MDKKILIVSRIIIIGSLCGLIKIVSNHIKSLDNTIQQGIDVRGEFRQKGTDLVATVKKVENRNGNQALNNPVFAR